jgi:alpha-tubulin suppressor-like RCC1 family protein
MNARIALVLPFVVACTQRAELFERIDADGSSGDPNEAGAPSDGGSANDAAPQPDGAVGDDSGTPMPVPKIVVSSGLDHACAIVEGALWCWGMGSYGRLGVGDNGTRTSPVRVDENDDWVSVCGGDEHTCALRADRSVYCWGRNLHGELGLGHFSDQDLPQRVPSAAFVRIACGGANTCGLTTEGALSCWGDNFEGKLGQDDDFSSAMNSATPLRVAPGTAFRELAVGQGHVCAVANNGALWCWGRNSNGQLGIETPQEQQRAPARVSGLDDMREVAAGMAHTCAIEVSGKLWCWGTDNTGSLGLGEGVEQQTRPRAVGNASDWSQISVQWFHSCALRGSDAYCWGRNDEGQLGLGVSNARFVPTRVGPSGAWRDIGVGHFHTCGLRNDTVLCWGNNEAGQVGVGDTQPRQTPSEVAFR